MHRFKSLEIQKFEYTLTLIWYNSQGLYTSTTKCVLRTNAHLPDQVDNPDLPYITLIHFHFTTQSFQKTFQPKP